MTVDEYDERMGRIHKTLETISELTLNKAFVGSANPSNPDFVTLMKKHAELTALSSELTEQMMDQFLSNAESS